MSIEDAAFKVADGMLAGGEEPASFDERNVEAFSMPLETGVAAS